MSEERILCAAIWYKEISLIKQHPCKPKNIDKGIVLCGWRHGDVIAQMCGLKGLRTVNFSYDFDHAGDHEQGFLTSKNRFVDRREAFDIASEAKQIRGAMYDRNELYSEDIY